MRLCIPTLLALAPLFGACAISDLRPTELLEAGPTEARARRGHALLAESLKASGGKKAWQRFGGVDLRLEDQWRGLIGYLFRPWPGNPTQLQVHFELEMRSGKAEFLSGSHRGVTWAREGDQVWFQEPDQEREVQQHEGVRFLFAAYQYFFELPVRIAEAPIALFAGQREREGRRFNLVLATWDKPEPHLEHDQYLLWIAEDTGLIEIAQYTIRDKFRFATGVNFFSDFREVDGIWIPHAYWIARHLNDKRYVHRVQLEDVHFR